MKIFLSFYRSEN